ncbi:NADH dehydrogenase subunit 6 (mitochondrion) [Sitophilus oryzae]|uniref:NADH-ubiquinone oxidoreductase chain 6 n=1 Tax=Sitophilus oryzae TaxID=7048 RepID=A0A1B1UUM9_SITOR|nr:NADH dehydrogenase subunit 6 [Sitophilus oryzae]ANW06530.1 NADH dehydrogenase subunit 6 [Sitophilus oryzae]AQD17673.1 NADH dehydrogenase subunit 6 [Sitophilus oryzae]
MLMKIFMMSCIWSFMFIFLSHPLSMGLMIFLQTLCISFMTGFMYKNFWFSYILFLIMIGGMLVLFIYMTSIASNEKFKISNFLLLLFIMMILILMLPINEFMSNILNKNYSTFIQFNFSTMNFMNKYLTYPNILLMSLLVIYLLITLIMVTKISNFKLGPFRQKF